MVGKKILKELLERWNERVQWILSQNFVVVENAETQKARIAKATKDFPFFVTTYFPHLAQKPSGKFQIAAANYLLQHTETRALFEWARGHAKSIQLSLLVPLWLKIQVPKQLNVMVLVSKSEDAAVRLLGDLQAELQYNELYNKDFGKQMKKGNWTDAEFKTTDGCLFVALGRGQTPRGLKDRGKRPDYIVIDDIDDDELCRNPKRVSLVYEWCMTALLGTMAMGRGRFVVVGNRIAKESIIAKMAQAKNIHHTVVNALDKHGNPTWSENYTPKEIAELREFMGERMFQKEYMNNPITEGSVFLSKQIRWGKMHELKYYRTLVCYTDPSFKDSATADYKATMLIGKSHDGYYHLLKAFAAQTSVANMVQWHYQIQQYIDGKVPALYYMESNFLQELLLDEFRKVGSTLGHHIAIRGDARKKPDKFARIEALQPLFERGLIVFNEKEKESPGMKILVEQLLMFERGSKSNDDAPDALEGGIFLLNQRNRNSNATYAMGKRESRKF